MDKTIFQKEDNKYSLLWKDNYKAAHWKVLAKQVLKKTKNFPENLPMIDFGCGEGSAMDFFISKGHNVSGTDISSYSVNKQLAQGRKAHHTSLDDLSMIGDNEYVVGFCNDVIEHVPEDLIKPSLDEMARVCIDYLFISVCPTPSHHLSHEGENLHLTVKPKAWWEEQFSLYGNVEQIKVFLSRSVRYFVELKKDELVNI